MCAALLAAADQPWKDKKVPDWTDEDAKLVMSDSPWAKSVTPDVSRPGDSGTRPPGAGRGGGGGGQRRGGVSIGGIGFPGGGGIGYPGGGGQRRGGGYPGGGGGRGQRRPDDQTPTQTQTPPTLTLRWESALPMREAELKTRDTNAPTIDSSHYAIAVYGVPRRMVGDDSKSLESDLKKHAVLKRDGKKDLKPSGVMVLNRDDGPVIVYLFPRSKEITKNDRRVELDAQISRLKFEEPFFIDDMVYDGKLEL